MGLHFTEYVENKTTFACVHMHCLLHARVMITGQDSRVYTYVWVNSDDASSVPTARRPALRRARAVDRAMARARAAPTSRLATSRARLATARPRARVARRAATPDDDATKNCRRLVVRELRERLIASGAHDAAIVRRANKAALVEMCEALMRRERARERGAASGGGDARGRGGDGGGGRRGRRGDGDGGRDSSARGRVSAHDV